MTNSIEWCPAGNSFLAEVEGRYAALMETARRREPQPEAAESGLGGRLLYAGLLDEAGRALVVAGNIAGAATLTATADPTLQKQAVRDGVVDFLVTSLDEALRILKNEIRKGEAVAVCVAADPKVMEREMAERGVAPDLLRDVAPASSDGYAPGVVSVSWRVATMPVQWLPKLDALAVECLPAQAGGARRWLQRAPRYMGRMVKGERLLTADAEFAACFAERVRRSVEAGEIATPVTVHVCGAKGCEESTFSPGAETIAR